MLQSVWCGTEKSKSVLNDTSENLLKNGGDIFGQKHSDRKRHIPEPRCRNIEKSLEVEQREVDGVYQVA